MTSLFAATSELEDTPFASAATRRSILAIRPGAGEVDGVLPIANEVEDGRDLARR